MCVGESFAKLELPLIMAMLFQKLEFRPPPGKEESFKVEMLPGSTQIMAEPYEIIAVPRA